MSKISLFVPRESMLFQAHNILQEEKYHVDDLYEVKSEDVVKKARECIANGTSIFIARGLHATLIKQYTDATVIDIVVTAQEMALLITRAKKIIKKDRPSIAVIAPKNMLCDMSYFESIYEINLKIYYEESKNELEEATINAYENQVDIIIGGETAVNKATSLGIPSLFLSTTEESLKNAIKIADNVKHAMESEKKSNAQLETILDYSFTGVIKLDTGGKILVINKIMESFFADGEKFIGRSVFEILQDITTDDFRQIIAGEVENKAYFFKVAGNNFYAVLAPILVDGSIDGAILSCHKVLGPKSNIENEQKKYKAGFVAAGNFKDIVCESKKMHETVHLAKLYANSDFPVMITGETGTERRLLAQSIHNFGTRSKEAFVMISCEGMEESLQRDLIYGEKGAVLDAKGGTILIEEVDKMSIANQYSLFQIIKYKILRSKYLDVRVICTSRKNISELLSHGEILEELYYVLEGLNLFIPPLRERKADLSIMIDAAIKKINEKYSRLHHLNKGAKDILMEYDWNGNILQLDNFIERLILTATKRSIEEKAVKELLDILYIHDVDIVQGEKAAKIKAALKRYEGNRVLTAKALGISKATLWRWMKKYELES